MKHITPSPQTFGGEWTKQKLDILEAYLDTYTKALKNQSFKLMYVDAFAGSGTIRIGVDSEVQSFINGSAFRAAAITGKPFDKLIFIEKDPARANNLQKLKLQHRGRDIEIERTDANAFLSKMQYNWHQWRGVLFLDPFGTQVSWNTLKTISNFKALDTWILFPVSAIARMLPKDKVPDEGMANSLTRIFGDESWSYLYRTKRQMPLFGPDSVERQPGVDGLLDLYKNRIENVFGVRFLKKTKTLKNSKNAHLFEFMFCVGNQKGASVAFDIANHILNEI